MEQYYLRITESGTTFAEKIEIDEEKDLEYFHVPAHNDVTEAADYLYDFKNVSETTKVAVFLMIEFVLSHHMMFTD